MPRQAVVLFTEAALLVLAAAGANVAHGRVRSDGQASETAETVRV
ncbi:hypothetical protein MSAS_32980 [Mycobacterium saskatchewanense]|nr:hypothetical protein MSAS_32980 [Mycobacterium saskatchewanense]